MEVSRVHAPQRFPRVPSTIYPDTRLWPREDRMQTCGYRSSVWSSVAWIRRSSLRALVFDRRATGTVYVGDGNSPAA